MLSLYINVADPAVFILAGTLPIEAEMHIKAITLYGNITRAKKSSIEPRICLHKRQIGLVAFFENADLSDCSI
jgi:bifunctional N-acetylglucosamine-1-phosphate-uridyltransferase/glucosamine-1-phosphate-acetyltransferase GlmU-like protein